MKIHGIYKILKHNMIENKTMFSLHGCSLSYNKHFGFVKFSLEDQKIIWSGRFLQAYLKPPEICDVILWGLVFRRQRMKTGLWICWCVEMYLEEIGPNEMKLQGVFNKFPRSAQSYDPEGWSFY